MRLPTCWCRLHLMDFSVLILPSSMNGAAVCSCCNRCSWQCCSSVWLLLFVNLVVAVVLHFCFMCLLWWLLLLYLCSMLLLCCCSCCSFGSCSCCGFLWSMLRVTTLWGPTEKCRSVSRKHQNHVAHKITPYAHRLQQKTALEKHAVCWALGTSKKCHES